MSTVPVIRRRSVVARLDRWLPKRKEPVPFVPGNEVRVLCDGGAFFEAMVAAIQTARHYILVETYILRADNTGWRVARALAERAQAGVEVLLSYDSFGSMGLDPALLAFFAANQIQAVAYAPLSLHTSFVSWNRRNHRKTLVVDGQIALVGGLNIADDYASVEDGGRGWRDTGCQVQGPAIAQLEALFRKTWKDLAGTDVQSPPIPCAARPTGWPARFVGNFARRGRADIRRTTITAINRATKSIRLTHAYFAPDGRFLRTLVAAARRGVKVELLLAGNTDVVPVLLISRGLYGYLMKNGVQVYEWHERVLHAKTTVIDGEWLTIGSSNLNRRSFVLDLEANVTVVSAEIGREMDAMFERDRGRSRAIDPELWKQRPLWPRLVEWFFGLFRRMV